MLACAIALPRHASEQKPGPVPFGCSNMACRHRRSWASASRASGWAACSAETDGVVGADAVHERATAVVSHSTAGIAAGVGAETAASGLAVAFAVAGAVPTGTYHSKNFGGEYVAFAVSYRGHLPDCACIGSSGMGT